MSTFFAELLQRNLQPTLDVRPRLPARFELPGEALPGMEAEEAPPVAAPLRRQAPMAAPSMPTASPIHPKMEGVEPSSTLAPRPHPPILPQPSAEQIAITNIFETHTHLPTPDLRKDEIVGPEGSPPRPQVISPRISSSPITPVPAAPPPPAAEQRAPEPRPIFVETRSSAILPRPTLEDAPHHAPELLRPEINVRVHIGRIEVRVPSPPPRAAPPQRSAPAPLRPAHSLDDILRRKGR